MSPCPTSSTTISLPRGAGGPTRTAAHNTVAAMPIHLSPLSRGCGHRHHSHTAAATQSTPADVAAPNAIAAPGTEAIRPPIQPARSPTAAPAVIGRTATFGAKGSSATVPSPASRTTLMSGATSTLDTGAISDTVPNTAAEIGIVAAWAVSVRATGPARPRSAVGVADTVHDSTRRLKSTNPATAATESMNPISNATGGWCDSATTTAAARAASLSALRPPVTAPAATAAISHARKADGCTPVATTYTASVPSTTHMASPRLT